jgi:hypothetical protein
MPRSTRRGATTKKCKPLTTHRAALRRTGQVFFI